MFKAGCGKLIFLILSAMFFCAPLAFSQEKKSQENVADDTATEEKIESSEKNAEENEKTLITIINALTSGNKKDEANGDDLLTFEGNVKISVEKGATKTIISADRVSYNRKREMLFAEGGVKLEQTEKNGSTQLVTSDTLLFNTATLEGVFDNSRVIKTESNAIKAPSGSKITVASELFARDDSGTIAFKNGSLTFCDDEEKPHWRIKASRIWLLPGNEFAFLNGLIYVGAVPVFYLPAFYYPKDELIFNPVFGYRNRAGFFFQTTTYLYGRKPLDTSDNSDDDDESVFGDYYSLIKPTKLMDQKREGLILHNLDTEYKGDTTDYLKLMFDWYSHLGFSTGFDGVYHPKDKFFPVLEGKWIFGFSNSVFQESESQFYFPFSSSGTTYKDEANLMGIETPFRYKGGLKISNTIPFNYSIDLPIYSDPFFDYDFADRQETMNWFSYLLDGPTQENSDKTEEEKFEAAEITSFTWSNKISYDAKLPDSIRPYLNTLSITTFDSSILFSEKDADLKIDSDDWYKVTPSRKFFYPSTITPLNTSLKIEGTIFSTSVEKKIRRKSKYNKELSLEFKKPGFFLLEEIIDEEDPGNSEKIANPFDEEIFLPNLNFSKPKTIDVTEFSYSLTYSLMPDFASQISYASESLDTAFDFNWNRAKSSYFQVKTPISLSQEIGYYDNFFGIKNTITFEPFYQTHPYISNESDAGGYSEEDKKTLVETDYKASYLNILNENVFSFKPFVYYPNFKDTGLSWNTSIKWLRTEFIGDSENPTWDYLTVDWTDAESITAHTLNTTLAANEFDEKMSQSLIFTVTLPPQVEKYYSTLNLKFPHLSLGAETGVGRTSLDDYTWKKEPFKQVATVDFFDSKMKFTESFNYELEEEHADSLKLALTCGGFQFAYTMRYTDPYDFDKDKGWVKQEEKEFIPYSASLAYAPKVKKFKKWKNRIEYAPGIDTSIVYDFVRPTNSYFIFSPSLTFRLNKAFYIKFSTTSRNDVIYRYFQDVAGNHGTISGETNPFVDLVNGFRFDDESLRRSSGFKLKSFDIMMMHDLHDWDLKCQFKIEPRLITSDTKKYYDFSPYFMLSVVWRPMDSFKTKIEDKYGDFVLNGSKKDKSKDKDKENSESTTNNASN